MANTVTEQIAEIGLAAYAVYGVLARHTNGDGRCWPSVARIAAAVGLTPRSVRQQLRALEGRGLIVTEFRKVNSGNKTSIYRLLTPQEPPEPAFRTPGTQVPQVGNVASVPYGTQVPPEQDIVNKTQEQDLMKKPIVPSAHVLSPDVQEVWNHYKTHRPKVRVLGEDVRKKVAARLVKDGFTVAELCAAIDGNFRSPHHCGQNETGTEYHELELIVRDSKHVNQFLAVNSQPGKALGDPLGKEFP